MKRLTIGVFSAREDAEKAINSIHNELNIAHDDISYVYRNTDGEVAEVDAEDVSTDTPGEGAVKGAKIGGTIGALAGIATIAGVVPVIGPLFAAGPITAALGLTGAVGTAAAGALTGAAAGGLIGALVNLGVGDEHAQQYADYVSAGNILVITTAEDTLDVATVMSDHQATDVNVYEVEV